MKDRGCHLIIAHTSTKLIKCKAWPASDSSTIELENLAKPYYIDFRSFTNIVCSNISQLISITTYKQSYIDAVDKFVIELETYLTLIGHIHIFVAIRN